MPAAKADKTGNMQWWRCYHGAPNDPKWRLVAARLNAGEPSAAAPVRPGDVWAVASCLYDHASQAKDRGSIARLDPEEIATMLGYPAETVQRIFDGLRDKDVHDGKIICAWSERQPKKEDPTAAQRKRIQRQRDKEGARTGAQGARTRPETPEGHAASHHVTHGHAMSRDVTTEERREEDSRSEEKESPPIAPLPGADAWPVGGGRKAKAFLREVFDRIVETHPPTVGGSVADARVAFERMAEAGELPPPRILMAASVEYAIEMRDLHANQEKAGQTKQKVVHLVNWFGGKRWEGPTLKRAAARVMAETARTAMIEMLRGSLGPIAEDLFREFNGADALVALLAEADLDPGPPMVIRFHKAFRLAHVRERHPRLDEICAGLVKWDVRTGADIVPLKK